MNQPLRVIAVASSEETRNRLTKQLAQYDFLSFDGVVLELSDAQTLWQHERPDLLIIDLTGRELDACLFIEVINFNVDNKTTVFGLHKELDPNIILKAVSSGVKEFIQYPNDTNALDTAIEKHAKLLMMRSEVVQETTNTDKGVLWPIFAAKGGSGSSTVTVNLGHQMVQVAQKSVVLLDMDQCFSNLSAYLNIKPSYALSDLTAENPADVDDNLLKKITTHHDETGLDIIVSCKNVADENPLIPPELLERVLAYLQAHYDYVLVDLPSHTVDDYHQFFVDQADSVLLVSAMDILSLYKTRQYLELVKRHLDLNKFKLILNRNDLKAAVGLTNKNLEEQFKHPVYHRIPNNWNVNVEAMSLGQPLGLVQPGCDIVKAFEELACRLTGTHLSMTRKPSGLNMGGIFGRLTKRGEKQHVVQ